MKEASSQPTSRVVFVDVLRLVAAAQMVQGHCVHALLAPAYRSGPLFQVWGFARGLTSTIFLVLAGLSFALATRGTLDVRRGRGRRLRRALDLVLIGYGMHAPVDFLFGADLGASLRAFAVVDVLQCIGASLLFLEALHLLPTPNSRAAAAALAGALCFGLAPWAQNLIPSGFSRPFLNYLSIKGGSLFPCLPWSGYVLCGFALGSFALRHDERDASSARRLGLGALYAFGLTAASMLLTVPGPWQFSPAFSLFKLGLVFLLAASLAWLFRDRRALPQVLTALAGETLFIYVSHVFVLYAGHMGIAAHWGRRTGPWQGVLLACGLFCASGAGALGYRAFVRGLRQRWDGGTPARERIETSISRLRARGRASTPPG